MFHQTGVHHGKVTRHAYRRESEDGLVKRFDPGVDRSAVGHTVDRALIGLLRRSERLRWMAEVESAVRDGSDTSAVLADEVAGQPGRRDASDVGPRGRRNRSRLALTSGLLGITALALLFLAPVTYLVACLTGEEMVAYALLGANALALALGGTAAVALGIAALVRLSRRHNRQAGHGWAITGLCTGPVPMLIGGLAVLCVVLGNTGFVSSYQQSTPGVAYVPSHVDSAPVSFVAPASGDQATDPWSAACEQDARPPVLNSDQPPADAYTTTPSAAALPPSAAATPTSPPTEGDSILPTTATQSAE